jgi:hypothetical protein
VDPYVVLGVAHSATAAEIREAYLRRSKELHPDRLIHASEHERALATRAMQDVTVAYGLLRDRGDAAEPHAPRPTHAYTYTPTPQPEPAPRSRRRVLVVGLAAVVVLSGLALAGSGTTTPAPDPERDGDLSGLKGMCITLQASGRFEDVIDCTRPHDARVVEVVDKGMACPIWADATLPGPKQDLCLDNVAP